MKVVGIIVEYNPFHNGHLHHLKETIKLSSRDILIAVTSGNVVMRGDISCINKFDKARIAVDNGIDLVVELPAVNTLQSSDHFAKSAIKILGELGCTEIYFGSESDNIKELEKVSNIINSDEYSYILKQYLKDGMSYSVASNKVLNNNYNYRVNSNDILGISYIRAISELGYDITPMTIKRLGTDYNDNLNTLDTIASATFIRFNKDYGKYVPSNTYKELKEKDFMDIEKLVDLLRYKIITSSKESLKHILHIKEGIENKIKSCDFNSIDDLINILESKRYNKSYIRRLLVCILFNITKESDDLFYIRVLGYNSIGASYIRQVSKNSSIIIYKKLKDGISNKTDIEINISKLLSKTFNTFDYKNEYKEPYILSENNIEK